MGVSQRPDEDCFLIPLARGFPLRRSRRATTHEDCKMTLPDKNLDWPISYEAVCEIALRGVQTQGIPLPRWCLDHRARPHQRRKTRRYLHARTGRPLVSRRPDRVCRRRENKPDAPCIAERTWGRLLWRWVEPETVGTLDFHSHITLDLCKDSQQNGGCERKGHASRAALSLPGVNAGVSRAER